MVTLQNKAFIAITGNGLSISEDLVRRFITCELDAQCEAPEHRSFPPDFLGGIERRRSELLGAVLTIWRFGRQNASDLLRGVPLGSFERWTEWCRDPFIALGCPDPVKRVETFKARDPHRWHIVELFQVWAQHHGAAPVTVHGLAQPVKVAADPHNRGRQYLARHIQTLAGTRANGFVLTRQEGAGRWAAATYALTQSSSTDTE
jgi:hypothetical protein